MRYPVRKINYPSDLTGQTNGRISRNLLRRVQPQGLLHHRAADAWEELRKAASVDGFTLTHTGSYRTYLNQIRLFRTRYSRKPTGRIPAVTRIWKGATWYLKRGASPSAAPGSSKHGLGLSVDVALIVNGKTVPITVDPDSDGPLASGNQWLRQNATSFGWCWEIADSADPNFEVWHLVYFAGDISPTKTAITPTNTEGPSS